MRKENRKPATEAEYKSRDKTRDRHGVKAARKDARRAKGKRVDFERGDWK